MSQSNTLENIFGVSCSRQNASIAYLPIAWDATTSYGRGCAQGPNAIKLASEQVDLCDFEMGEIYKGGLHPLDNVSFASTKNSETHQLVEEYRKAQSTSTLQKINSLCFELNEQIEAHTQDILDENKLPAIIGGEHSLAYPALRAVAKKQEEFGVLQLDAHMDLSKAYEGFQYSHASVMHNVITEVQNINILVQVGFLDFCKEELGFARLNKNKIKTCFDWEIASSMFSRTSWLELVEEIISLLPLHVWISFDVDSLRPELCPSTGTRPGGLEFNQANFLMSKLVQSGRKIIGFDICETNPGKDLSNSRDSLDAITSARILYKLSGYTLWSQGIIKPMES